MVQRQEKVVRGSEGNLKGRHIFVGDYLVEGSPSSCEGEK